MLVAIEREQTLVEKHVDRLPPRALDHELGAGLAKHRRRIVDQLARIEADPQLSGDIALGCIGTRRPCRDDGVDGPWTSKTSFCHG